VNDYDADDANVHFSLMAALTVDNTELQQESTPVQTPLPIRTHDLATFQHDVTESLHYVDDLLLLCREDLQNFGNSIAPLTERNHCVRVGGGYTFGVDIVNEKEKEEEEEEKQMLSSPSRQASRQASRPPLVSRRPQVHISRRGSIDISFSSSSAQLRTPYSNRQHNDDLEQNTVTSLSKNDFVLEGCASGGVPTQPLQKLVLLTTPEDRTHVDRRVRQEREIHETKEKHGHEKQEIEKEEVEMKKMVAARKKSDDDERNKRDHEQNSAEKAKEQHQSDALLLQEATSSLSENKRPHAHTHIPPPIIVTSDQYDTIQLPLTSTRRSRRFTEILQSIELEGVMYGAPPSPRVVDTEQGGRRIISSSHLGNISENDGMLNMQIVEDYSSSSSGDDEWESQEQEVEVVVEEVVEEEVEDVEEEDDEEEEEEEEDEEEEVEEEEEEEEAVVPVDEEEEEIEIEEEDEDDGKTTRKMLTEVELDLSDVNIEELLEEVEESDLNESDGRCCDQLDQWSIISLIVLATSIIVLVFALWLSRQEKIAQ